MLIWAIQTAGLNRAKIRDVLAYRTEPFPGVTGDIPLSSAMDDAGEVFLTRRENGQWNYLLPRRTRHPARQGHRTNARRTRTGQRPVTAPRARFTVAQESKSDDLGRFLAWPTR